ncbi:lipopolysaccharide transport periplasmic protein LptA [Pseudomaricurvus sp. HS19]|uniref:lipopolysaccharide transport periplasmic protein LptA n=1 Tax=Pseudomaricurvus sp. HS19 TaxID=2692626 RepID=UPI00136A6590|nr:lipopolysaccharide transport periplasmic protein LptA [Pseudomaricurvus sp. HS19]MYM64634.1 lipopolysaccharide transport periplasmic protein LptA [Pseudomaricurvus sp. HS19]
MKFSKMLCGVLLCALGATASNSLWALASDREQPIYISSDRAERNEKAGTTIYSGAVQMDQGSMRILADKVVIHSVNNEVDRIIATGTPAHYQQQPAPDKQVVTARGERIEYLISNDMLHLTTNASLTQADGTSMSGQRIDYNIKESVATAEGNNTTEGERVHIVIQPKRN